MLIPLNRVLQYLERFEQKAELLYRRFAGRFAEDGSLALTFAKLADQEKAHRDLILFQLRVLKGSEELFLKVEFDANDLLALNEEIDLAMSQEEISRDEAFGLCFRMEQTLWERHRDVAAQEIGGDLRTLMQSLVSDDRAHSDLIDGLRKSSRPSA